jgi:hypothetical protein
VPHFTSVINWTLRLGLGLLQQVVPVATPWLAIIDHSIDVGTKKALVVLRVSLTVLAKRGSAICLEDCECVGLTISEQINGATIAADLQAIFEKAGRPAAIVKDGEYTLNKGVKVWQENQDTVVPVIYDIGHAAANALKKEFENDSRYLRFISMINQCAKSLRQTDLAFLIPPKLRGKGRFLSISNLGKWADKVNNVLAPPTSCAIPRSPVIPKGHVIAKHRASPQGRVIPKGRAIIKRRVIPQNRVIPKGRPIPKSHAIPKSRAIPKKHPTSPMLTKLRKVMPGFQKSKSFIQSFADTTHVVARMLEVLKNKGLNRGTAKQCSQLLEWLPRRSKIRQQLQSWLDSHLKIYENLAKNHPTDLSLMVSSDIIESLFGNFKHILERSPQADMNRTTLIIPSLCGSPDAADVKHALAQTRHNELRAWEQKNIPSTLRKNRQAFFATSGKHQSQKPGKNPLKLAA